MRRQARHAHQGDVLRIQREGHADHALESHRLLYGRAYDEVRAPRTQQLQSCSALQSNAHEETRSIEHAHGAYASVGTCVWVSAPSPLRECVMCRRYVAGRLYADGILPNKVCHSLDPQTQPPVC